MTAPRRASPRAVLLTLALLLGLLGLTACGGAAGGASPAAARPLFTLTDTDGAPFEFAARTSGLPTLLLFGYTHCPDECPTMLAGLAQALRDSPAEVRDAVTVVFATTDPARDDAAALREYLDRFDPPGRPFVGLTGSPDDVAAAQTATGLPVAVIGPPSGGGYSVSHPVTLSAYGRDDRAQVVSPAASVDDYRAYLARLAAPLP